MPRPRGPLSADSSTPVCVRLPAELARAVFAAAKADHGSVLATHLRNVIRRSLDVPLDFDAGYQEGHMQGWQDASQRFRDALKGAGK